jgi:chemotaxis protein methyltransferase CheR
VERAGSGTLSCIDFLQWALPRMQLCWRGFRNVRGQVCKRIRRRHAELGLSGLEEYRGYLEAHPAEWSVLAGFCRVTITRFGRDLNVWRRLVDVELPRLATLAVQQSRSQLSVWSAGCAGGEEPYTLSIAWQLELAPRWPDLRLGVLATDVDDEELERARAGQYPEAVLTELDARWRAAAFERDGGRVRLREAFRANVRLLRHDLRAGVPPGAPFDVILCRNLAFSYFDEALQRQIAVRLRAALRPAGTLVIGAKEDLPDGIVGLSPESPAVYRAEPG